MQLLSYMCSKVISYALQARAYAHDGVRYATLAARLTVIFAHLLEAGTIGTVSTLSVLRFTNVGLSLH